MNGNIKNKFNGLIVIDPFSLVTPEQKQGLKRHKNQNIEQGKGYNMV